MEYSLTESALFPFQAEPTQIITRTSITASNALDTLAYAVREGVLTRLDKCGFLANSRFVETGNCVFALAAAAFY